MNRHFLDKWRISLPGDLGKLELFLDNIFKLDSEKLDSSAMNFHRQVFDEIDCLECASCCKTTPAMLTAGDIKRISKHLGIPPKIFKRKYVLEDVNGELSFNRIPCIFLAEDNKCVVYEVRPSSCRDYPHTESGNFKQRAGLHKKNLRVCPAVFDIVKRMTKPS